MAQTVIGMFDNAAEAQQAVQQLTSRGISRDNIDVANPGASSSASYSTGAESEHGSGIGNFFKSLFSSDDDDSDKYAHVARHSQSIVTVHARSAEEAESAADILDDCGAVNVDERASSYGYSGAGAATAGAAAVGSTAGGASSLGFDTARTGSSSTDSFTTGSATTGSSSLGTSDFSGTNNLTNEGTTKIPIIEENLEVGKREVLTGGTRLRSRIVERPVEESLRLREENVHVQRTPVDRAATSADLANFSEREIEMTETAEVPVVAKEARVVEEVSLGKEVNERTETVSDTVRKTEVDVEDLGTTTDTTRTGYTNSGSTNTGSMGSTGTGSSGL